MNYGTILRLLSIKVKLFHLWWNELLYCNAEKYLKLYMMSRPCLLIAPVKFGVNMAFDYFISHFVALWSCKLQDNASKNQSIAAISDFGAYVANWCVHGKVICITKHRWIQARMTRFLPIIPLNTYSPIRHRLRTLHFGWLESDTTREHTFLGMSAFSSSFAWNSIAERCFN